MKMDLLKKIIDVKDKAREIINGTTNSNNKNSTIETIKPVKDVPTNPKLVINSLTLQVAIAQWLGILSSAKRQGTSSFSIISHLNASELIRRSTLFVDSVIKEIDLKAAIIRFANLLAMTEISEDETCILDNFNEENLTFDCTLQSTGEVIKMGLSYGTMDDMPEIRMSREKGRRRYEYYAPYRDRDEKVLLTEYSNQLGENNLQFNRYVSEFTYYGHFTDDNNKLDIEIKYPDSLNDTTNNIYVDEQLLEKKLNELTFPFNIDEACRVIATALKVDPSVFQYINIVISRKQENGNFIEAQMAKFKDGEMTRFLIEKDGKVIDITDFGTWRHSSSQYTVSQNKDLTKNFECKNVSLDSIDQVFTPKEAISKAQEDIEKVKKLTKTILNNK